MHLVSTVLLVARVSDNNYNSTVHNTRFQSTRFVSEIHSVHSRTPTSSTSGTIDLTTLARWRSSGGLSSPL